MDKDYSLSYWQKPVTTPYTETDETNPRTQAAFPFRLVLILSYDPQALPINISFTFLSSPIRVTHLASGLTTVKISGENKKKYEGSH
jgi:hypothetical protein